MITLTIIACSCASETKCLPGVFFRNDTTLKINMEHNHGGLEDHVPFQMGDL